MIGRGSALQRLDRLLADARAGRAGALVVRAGAGMGKTSLLDAAEAAASGFVTLRARGVGSETTLAHAGLVQLLRPVRDHLDRVPGPQRRALDGALGWGAPTAGDDRYLVAAGTLSLLAAAADEQPVLVLVDDLHWFDPESAAAVLFAARRLDHDGVACVLATREGSPAGTALDGLETEVLTGLGELEAQALLGRRAAEAVVRSLAAETGGNPLALIEIGAQLTPAQLRGAAPLPRPLPTGDRLQSVYEPLVAGLTADGRVAVLLVAASSGAGHPVADALERRGIAPDVVLDRLEADGVLVREPGLVTFRHPLLRSAVWSSASAAERRAAHAALAEVLTDDHRDARTWHLGEAATGPDATLAAMLDGVAERERERLGYAAASSTLERAARLSDDPTLAAERLVAAVEDASLAGDVGRARALAADLDGDDPGGRLRGRALAAIGVLERCTGSLPLAADVLAQAADLTEGQVRIQVLAELAMVQHRLGDVAGISRAAAQMVEVADERDRHQRFLRDYIAGLAALGDGAHDDGRRRLTGAVDLLMTDRLLGDDPRYLVYAVFAAAWIELTPALALFLEGRLRNARERGALAVLVPALAMVSHGRTWLGDHAGAFADAGEAVELATELGFVADAAPAFELLAWEHAARGDLDRARAELARSAELVDRAGTRSIAAHLPLARAFCALCADDVDEVVAQLEPRLSIDGGRGSAGEVLGVAPLLVEAYVATGRASEAAGLAAQYAEQPEPDGRTRALIDRCRGLTEPDDDIAVAAFEAAIAAHVAAFDAPFELARTELLLGARLRRARRRVDARTHLRSARDRFAAMDLTLWAARATAELAATGETRRHGDRGIGEALTSQETRVAQLVSTGMTNAEVAAALFVSPKTVEHHLSSIYRKRGVRSRTELARTMAAE